MKLTATIAAVAASSLALCACHHGGVTPQGTGSNPIDTCSPGHPNLKDPTIVYKITINSGFSFKTPSFSIVTKAPKLVQGDLAYPQKTNAMYWDEDPSSKEMPYPAPSPTPGITPTPFDIVATLKQKNDSALIKLVINDPSIDFQSDAAGARDGKPNGSAMFCDFIRPAAQKVGLMRIYFPENSKPGERWIGSLNWGWLMNYSDGTDLPIFIDPSVDNDG